ncbi:unnamed protein product [Prorocentrum cordatum]|uniref:Phospholipase B-like n=1 Tax=Prorocentrum cordatum TaxID=2364126 RepID=A0ABN9Q1R3_9DINO|nr:unnamed protein product [Polarella glacialis]
MVIWALVLSPTVWTGVSAARTSYVHASDDMRRDMSAGSVAVQSSANESGCSLPLPMGPDHFANSVEQATEGAVQWFVLQCLLQRADQVGGDDPALAKDKARARKLVRRIWTLEAERHGAFGMTSDQFTRMLREKVSYGTTLSELMFDVHANDAMWELMSLIPQVADDDQMTGIAGFDYETVASVCRQRAPLNDIRQFANQSLLEMATGCTGGCTKHPTKDHTCGPSEKATCPEGTSCSCKKEFNKWAPAVFLGSYITVFSLESYYFSPKALAVAPVEPWAMAITSLISMKYTGCLCVPNLCLYSADADACGIMPHDGRAPYTLPGYPTLPYLGTKCARDPNLPNEGKCYVQRCGADDIGARKLGRVGDAVYNCHKELWDDYKYVPQKDRFAFYDAKVDKMVLSLAPDRGMWVRFWQWVQSTYSGK